MEGSPAEKLNASSGFSASRQFLVPWNQRIDFAVAMTRAQYPGASAVRAEDITINPFDGKCEATITDFEAHLNAYDFAVVSIQYSSVQSANQEQQADGTYLSYRQSLSAEFLTIPSRALVWDDNDEPVSPDTHGAVLIPRTEHVLTWNDVPSPNWATLSDLRGHVNTSAVTIPVIGLSAPAETLLFKGAEIGAKISSSGAIQYDLTITLSEKKIKAYSDTVYGWNHAYRDDPAGWHKPVNSDGETSYPTGSLLTLLTQAS